MKKGRNALIQAKHGTRVPEGRVEQIQYAVGIRIIIPTLGDQSGQGHGF